MSLEQRVVVSTETKKKQLYSSGIILITKGSVPKVLLVEKKYTHAFKVLLLCHFTSTTLFSYLSEITVSERERLATITSEEYDCVFSYLGEMTRSYPKQRFFAIKNQLYEIAKLHSHLQTIEHGFWEFPKGKREAYEGHSMAALRELKEECGIELQASDLLIDRTGILYAITKKEQTPDLRTFNFTFFVCSIDEEKLTSLRADDSEVKTAKLVPLNEVTKYLRPLLIKALEEAVVLLSCAL